MEPSFSISTEFGAESIDESKRVCVNIKRGEDSKYLLKENDIVFARTGASAGRNYFYYGNEDPMIFAGFLIKFSIDEEKVLPEYVKYYCSSRDYRDWVRSIATGSTRPNINAAMYRKMEVLLPPRKQQEALVDTLSCLDAKIELNNKINENLEAQAQAIFKSWFVDFEPFQDGEFVESELGLIPEGWRLQKLGEVIDIKYGKDHKSLADGEIPVYGSGGVMRYADTAIYDGETVLIPRKGTLDNVMLVNHPFWSVDTMFYTEIRTPNFAKFLYQLLLTKDLVGMNVGSAVPSMTAALLNEIRFALPPAIILEKFEEVTASFYNMIQLNEKQNQVVSALRDTLLPKLMSGEIEVPID